MNSSIFVEKHGSNCILHSSMFLDENSRIHYNLYQIQQHLCKSFPPLLEFVEKKVSCCYYFWSFSLVNQNQTRQTVRQDSSTSFGNFRGTAWPMTTINSLSARSSKAYSTPLLVGKHGSLNRLQLQFLSLLRNLRMLFRTNIHSKCEEPRLGLSQLNDAIDRRRVPFQDEDHPGSDPHLVPGFPHLCSGLFPERFRRMSVIVGSGEIRLI